MDDKKYDPQKYPYHCFDKLSKAEKFTIRMIYFRKWRKLVNSKSLDRNQKNYFSYYFKEIHALHYLRVIQGSRYKKTSQIVYNFLFSKVNENLRAILLGLKPYNLTVFIQAVRSQVELNALLNKFLLDKAYAKEHLTLNEDRSKAKDLKTVININTLVSKLDESYIPYKAVYDELSLLLHPNPAGIKFYAQASKGETTDEGECLFSPKINYYFDETITATKEYDEWFKDKLWLFLTCVEHFLIMISKLDIDFFIDEKEEIEFTAVELLDVLSKLNEKQFNDFIKRDR
ncbi:hypothetical protein [Pseudomonas sp. UBA6323]|uniref:hypothetical protein n=1 Tax=Pseudomonas sp. UBA6323 TaxID=1947329 RepID=UPI0025E2D04E|nr:hypothetical protein [Pseudomonas sp. UBA6323]